MQHSENKLASAPPEEGVETLTCPIKGCIWSVSGGTDESRGSALADHLLADH